MKIRSLSIVVFCFLLISSIVTIFYDERCEAAENIIYVDDDSNILGDGTAENPYQSIQHAINLANEGDTIRVFGGTYNETLSINKKINLIGSIEEGRSVIYYGSSHKYTVEITANYVNFTDFVVNDNRNKIISHINGALIHVTSDGVRIQDNNIMNCNSYSSMGIHLDSAGDALIRDNIIDNNDIGIFADSSKTNDLVNNTISNCSSEAIKIQSSDNNRLYDNAVSKNRYGTYIKDCNGINISNNTIYSNTFRGIGLFNCENNIVKNNTIYDNSADGIYLESHECHVMGNIIYSNQIGIKLDGSNNIVRNNVISDSSSYGIYATSNSEGNDIYLNTLSSYTYQEVELGYNIVNAQDHGNNNWDNGSKGNIWGDYNEIDIQPNGVGDGIGDTPYTKGGVVDNYPLGVFLRPPDKPSNPRPWDGNDSVGLKVTLKVDVYDFDGEKMDIYFYRLTNISTTNKTVYQSDLIDIDENVESGGTASCSFGLDYDTVFSWQVNITDGKLSNQSDIWFFSTKKTPGDNDPPVANAGGPYSASINVPIKFNASGSYDTDGTIEFYRWNFGDDTSEILSICPTHTYYKEGVPASGTVFVTLTVIDNDGASDMDKFEVSIGGDGTISNQAPKSEIVGPFTGKKGKVITFDASGSKDNDGTIESYIWDFDDGSNDSGKRIEHTYQKTGTYTISLTVTDDDGASHTTTKTIKIESPAKAPESPGFEIILAIAAIFIIMYHKKRQKRK